MSAPSQSAAEVPAGVVLERAACPIGCAENDEIVVAGRDRINRLPGMYTVVRCRECGMMRTNPRPTPDSIGFYYPKDYGPYESTNRMVPAPGNEPTWKGLLKRLVADPALAIPVREGGRLLEVGCASGAFLDQMQTRGWGVEGIEFSAEAARNARARGLTVHVGAVEQISLPARSFDLIVGWMVLEHVHHPLRVLQKLLEWTRPGGMLIVSVPDAGSAEFRLFGDAWYGLHLPNHLYHYTADSLRRLMTIAGWSVERVQWQNNPNNLLQSLRFRADDRGWRGASDFLGSVIEGRRLNRGHQLLGLASGLLRMSGRMTVRAVARSRT